MKNDGEGTGDHTWSPGREETRTAGASQGHEHNAKESAGTEDSPGPQNTGAKEAQPERASKWAQRANSRVSGVHHAMEMVTEVTDYLSKHLMWIEKSRVNTGWTKENRELAYALLRVDRVFAEHDLDSNRHLDADELRDALAALWLPCSEEQIDGLILKAKSHKGLDINEFELFTFNLEQYYRKLFRQLDTDNNGAISFEELQAGMRQLKLKMDHKDQIAWFEKVLKIEPREEGGREEMNYIQWRHALMLLPPETSRWRDELFLSQFTSADANGNNFRPVRHRSDGPLLDLLAGFFAGCVSRTLTAPADRVTAEMQVPVDGKTHLSSSQVARKVWREGGWRGFFAGNLTNCAKVAPQSALFFALTDFFKREVHVTTAPGGIQLQSFVAGTLAGVVSQLVVYPLEPIKTSLTLAKRGQFIGFMDCARQLVAHEGVLALYKGVVPTLVGCIPYAGTQRLVYDALKQQHYERSESQQPSVLVNFGCALLSSLVGMTVSYPFVLVRTRLQVQGSVPDRPRLYNGMYDCFRQIIRNEGPGGLMRGLAPNLLKAAPGAAINFALYDRAKDWLRGLQTSWQRRQP